MWRTEAAEHATNDQDVYYHMVRGSLWSLLQRWGARGVGLVSTVILVRLLTPDDFGIAAMASLTMGLLETFADFGVTVLVIRERNPTRGYLDTAWTFRLLQGAIVAALLLLCAPFASAYFAEPRLNGVIVVAALTAIAAGAESVGMALVRKQLDFATDFRFVFYKRILLFAITVPAALILRNYWALVFGQLVATVLGTFMSYRMHPYRPRFSMAEWKRFVHFATSVVPASTARFFRNKADVFVVGRLTSTALLGQYNVAAEFAGVITQELTLAVGRALLPGYATLTHEPKRLAGVYLNSMSAIWSLSCPIGLGLCAVAPDFVRVVLGPEWLPATTLIQWLSLYYIARSLLDSMSGSILLVSGNERLSLFAVTSQVIVLVIAFVLGAVATGARGVAQGAGFAGFVLVVPMTFLLTRALPVTVLDVLGRLWRPVVSSCLMWLGVRWLGAALACHDTMVRLVATTLIGVAIYLGASLAVWRAVGRPSGPEAAIASWLNRRVRRAN